MKKYWPIEPYDYDTGAGDCTEGGELKKLTDEVDRLNKEIESQSKQAEQLSEISRKDNLLVEEYRQRIDTLSGLVNVYKAAADENKELHTLNADLSNLEAMRLQENRYKEALDGLAGRKDLEKGRELLALQAEYQAKLEKANEEANVRFRDLFEQMNKRRDQEGGKQTKSLGEEEK